MTTHAPIRFALLGSVSLKCMKGNNLIIKLPLKKFALSYSDDGWLLSWNLCVRMHFVTCLSVSLNQPHLLFT